MTPHYSPPGSESVAALSCLRMLTVLVDVGPGGNPPKTRKLLVMGGEDRPTLTSAILVLLEPLKCGHRFESRWGVKAFQFLY